MGTSVASTELVSVEQPKYKRGMSPNSRKNLLGPRWKKGESGNPQGTSLSADLKRALNKPLRQPSEDAPAREMLIYSTLKGAIKREPTPFKEVWDRTEGKVADKTDHTFNGEGLSDLLLKLRGHNPPPELEVGVVERPNRT